ncbi:MAG: ferrochelatase, partial [Pseudomonadota bacterium]
DYPKYEFKVVIAMRYWHPFTDEAVAQVKKYNPDKILLLPLYPQFSTATSGSSLLAWYVAASKAGIVAETKEVCCYPYDSGYVNAYADLIAKAIKGKKLDNFRVLFSAHGLPESIVKKGDPYQWQVEQSVNQIVLALNQEGLDYQICYQSRVGPMKWIGPSTDNEIMRAATDGKDVVLVPVAFVSEHSETLVELDIEYKELADEHGVKNYTRVATVDDHAKFIAGMAEICGKLLKGDSKIFPPTPYCPLNSTNCWCRQALNNTLTPQLKAS